MRTDICKKIEKGIFYLDCGMGTSLQGLGIDISKGTEMYSILCRDVVVRHHTDCYMAGSDLIYTNTFGINGLKYTKAEIKEMITASLDAAVTARNECISERGEDLYIGLDIGPTGKMLEPYGDLTFEDAVNAFAETIRSADESKYDVIIIETMTDCLETKAAVIAAKENSKKPVFVTNVYDKSGRMLTGADCEAMVAMLEGLGVSALGLNCSLGPADMLDVTKRIASLTSLPLIVKPNAGLPVMIDEKPMYTTTPKLFASEMSDIVSAGAGIIGGCCGTTPEYISELVSKIRNMTPKTVDDKKRTVVSSSTHAVCFGGKTVIIGERINPTGKKKFKEALLNSDMGYVMSEATGQADRGADILDVNVGLADIDEKEVMLSAVKAVQSVCDLPLQIDTADPVALEAALRIYVGKPLINSVNGTEKSMSSVFPLVKKYGGTVIGLTLDENGIPETAEKRVSIAKKIIDNASKYGIGMKDIIIDPLAMAVSAIPDAASVTLETVRRLSSMGIKTCLGVSNVSFGLPGRENVNSAFLACAMQNGLSAAIINPYSEMIMNVCRATEVVLGRDKNCSDFISSITEAGEKKDNKSGNDPDVTLFDSIVKGMSDKARNLAIRDSAVKAPLEIINEEIVPALDTIGRDFEAKKVFLPRLLMAADAAGAAFSAIRSLLPKKDGKYTIVIATVKGDIHDIGKNIVATLLENYGYNVIDLGKDVPPEVVLDSAIRNKAVLVGLSALMTTTLPAMKETVELLKRDYPVGKVVVGGAVLTKEYADSIGADFYAKDAMETVRYAESLSENES